MTVTRGASPARADWNGAGRATTTITEGRAPMFLFYFF